MKGQVTVFIIMGIIILLATGVFIYVSGQREQVLVPPVTQVPLAIQPYKQAVTSCVENNAINALQSIGVHGGYVDALPASGDGEAVRFSPESDLTVASWWYLKSQNTCVGDCEFSSKRPYLYAKDGSPSIEAQLQQAVKSSYQNCLEVNGFEVKKVGSIDVKVSIAPSDVVVIVNAPVTVLAAGSEYTVNDVAVVLPVNLKEMYELATTIANLQSSNRFLEKQARSLISTFSDVNSNKLPPLSAMTFNVGPGEFWLKFDIKDKVVSLLQAYVPMLQVFGTRNYAYLQAPGDVRDKKLFEALYNRNMLIPSTEPHESTNVKFTYLDWWEPYFDLNCNGEICRSEDVLSSFLFVFGMQRYNFAYDISYPVLVELENPLALNGRGFSLQFMLESNLRNNEPMPAQFKPLTFPAVGETGSMLCDFEQANVPLSITASDGKKPIDVPIMFSCGVETCALGSTQNGVLETFAPRCLGSQVIAQKQGSWPTSVKVDTDDGKEKSVSVVVEPYRKLELKVKKYLVKKSVDQWIVDTAAPVLTTATDSGIITFTREEGNRMGYTTAGEPGATIDLLPGKYKVTANLLSKENLVFPVQKRCFTAGLFGEEKCYDVPPQQIVFNDKRPYPNGGSSVTWTVTSSELDSGKILEVGVISIAESLVPVSERQVEDLDQLGKLSSYYDSHAYLLVPKVQNG